MFMSKYQHYYKELYMEKLTSYLETLIGSEDRVKKFIPVTAAVIIKKGDNNENLVLLIQRSKNDHWPNFWEFPRGKCDNAGKGGQENLFHCLKREVKEEVGLDIIPEKLIDTFDYLADKGTRKSTCYNYLCKMKDENQKVKLSKEHQNFKWISNVGECELMLLPDQKKTIVKVLNTNKKIIDYPDNEFTKNNNIEEYLRLINKC